MSTVAKGLIVLHVFVLAFVMMLVMVIMKILRIADLKSDSGMSEARKLPKAPRGFGCNYH